MSAFQAFDWQTIPEYGNLQESYNQSSGITDHKPWRIFNTPSKQNPEGMILL
jgi:hypothetical protein